MFSLSYYKFKIKYALKRFKFRCQRFVRGWADEDSWDIAAWFTGQMKCILPEFYKNNNGIPAGMTEEEWNKIILRMIYLLDGMTDEGAAEQLYGSDANMTIERWRVVAEHRRKSHKEFFKLFTLYFYELWW